MTVTPPAVAAAPLAATEGAGPVDALADIASMIGDGGPGSSACGQGATSSGAGAFRRLASHAAGTHRALRRR